MAHSASHNSFNTQGLTNRFLAGSFIRSPAIRLIRRSRARFHTGNIASVFGVLQNNIALFDTSWNTIVSSFFTAGATTKRGKRVRKFTGSDVTNDDSARITVQWRRNDGTNISLHRSITLDPSESARLDEVGDGFELGDNEYVQCRLTADRTSSDVRVTGKWRDD